MYRPSVSLREAITAIAVCTIVAMLIGGAMAANQASSPEQQIALTCLSNGKQLGLGVLMYSEDYDARFPSGGNWQGQGSGWAQQVEPYVRSGSVYHCPADTTPGDLISYGYDANLVRVTRGMPSAPVGISLEQVRDPEITVVLFEVEGNTGAYNFGQYPGGTPPLRSRIAVPSDIHATDSSAAPVDGYSPGGRGTARPAGAGRMLYATGPMLDSSARFDAAPRHEGKSTFVFTDGHAKLLAPGSVSAGRDNPDPGSCGGSGYAASAPCALVHQLGTFSAI